jgi:hypothetical protein
MAMMARGDRARQGASGQLGPPPFYVVSDRFTCYASAWWDGCGAGTHLRHPSGRIVTGPLANPQDGPAQRVWTRGASSRPSLGLHRHGPFANSVLYARYRLDPETGLYHVRHGAYDPGARGPAAPGGLRPGSPVGPWRGCGCRRTTDAPAGRGTPPRRRRGGRRGPRMRSARPYACATFAWRYTPLLMTAFLPTSRTASVTFRPDSRCAAFRRPLARRRRLAEAP